MAAISPENLDDNTDSDDPQKISKNTVDLNTNHKDTYIGDFVECIDDRENDKKIYYPYDLFIQGLDSIALYIPNYSSRDPRYAGKKEVLPKLSYGDKKIVGLRGKVGEDLSSYFHKNGMGSKVYLTKYSGELDITLDDDGKEVYTLKKINSFIKRMCDKFGKCFSRRQSVQEGSSKKRAKKTRKQRKPRKSKRNHKK